MMKDTIVEDKILTEYRAVAGTSTNPEWPSYRVANYLAEQGYNIIPVNSIVEEVLGRKSYAKECIGPKVYESLCPTSEEISG